MDDILRFYPIEHRNLKTMDKNSKLYKKELLKFMQNFNIVGKLVHLNKENEGYKFKKQYQKYIKIMVIWFLVFFAINFVENVANEIRGVFYWTNIEIMHFTRYMIGFCFSFGMATFYAFKARSILLEYFSFLIQNTAIKCPNLSVDEVLKLINIFEYNPGYIDTKFRYACINCLQKFTYEINLSDKINDDYNIVYECPKCNSEYIFYYNYEDNPNDKFLRNLHEFWIKK